MKRVLSLIIIFFMFTGNIAYSKKPNIKTPSISSWYAVVMDCESGRVLFEKDSKKVVPMASTTKIMTAIVAIENSSLKEIATISKKASSVGGSTIGLREGQNLTMEELLYGLMLQSGNDCAIAIAEHIAGSVEKFMMMMNSKAFDIGAFNSHFITPHGLDADGHFTTAYDLALITKYALNIEFFAKIVSSKNVTLNGAMGTRKFNNINKLLWSYDGADGVKTGYTGKAGKCLVSSASHNGKRIICVVLNSPLRWNDSKKLLEYSFKNFENGIMLNNSDYCKKIPVTMGEEKELTVGFSDTLTVPITVEEKDSLSIEISLPDTINAPVYKDMQVGKLILYSNGKEIFSVPYKAMDSIDKSDTRSIINRIFVK